MQAFAEKIASKKKSSMIESTESATEEGDVSEQEGTGVSEMKPMGTERDESGVCKGKGKASGKSARGAAMVRRQRKKRAKAQARPSICSVSQIEALTPNQQAARRKRHRKSRAQWDVDHPE